MITADMERSSWVKLLHRDYSFKENKTRKNLLGELIIPLVFEQKARMQHISVTSFKFRG
jgi:hypothetical protein